MPGTARERGLADPFDPEQAVPKAAHFLADLKARFGNWGLAAAAYNGGPSRVASWLAGRGGLPFETRILCQPHHRLAGRGLGRGCARRPGRREPAGAAGAGEATASCTVAVAAIRAGRGGPSLAEAPFAPWGVQLAGNFSKARALSAFQRAGSRHAAIIGELRPMVIGTRLRSRGTRAFYRVRIPAQSGSRRRRCAGASSRTRRGLHRAEELSRLALCCRHAQRRPPKPRSTRTDVMATQLPESMSLTGT